MKIVSWFRALRGKHLNSELLSAYLDGQVRPAERRRVEQHLSECEACRRELASLRQTVALLHALPRVPVPRAFTLSQAQVELERPIGRPGWFGGAVAGLAAVTTVVLVVAVAATLLRRPTWQPAYELARVAAPAAATAAPVERPVEATAPRPVAPAAPAAVPAAQEAVAEKAAEDIVATAPARSEAAVAPTKAPAAAPTRPPAPAPAVGPTAVPATRPTVPPAATAEKPAALAAVAPAETPAPMATAGVPAVPTRSSAPAPAAPAITSRGADEKAAVPAPAPAADPARLLAPDAALVFAVAGELWAADRDAGLRRIVRADGLAAPVVSDDRSWIAYRRTVREGSEVWAVRWTDGDPRLVTSEAALNEGHAPDYGPRRIEEVFWAPGRRALAVTVSAAARAADAAPRFELWLFDVEPVGGRLIAAGDLVHRPLAAPDGAAFVFLRRDPGRPTDGQMWLVSAVAAPERAVLRFPLPADAARVVLPAAWLPDGSALRVAVPEAGRSGLTLYQVELKGDARPIGHVEADGLFWSADGSRLAFVRPAGDAPGPHELFVARGDGADPLRYATLARGRFLAWSPDAARFLYEDEGALYVGTIGQPAQRLAAAAGEARWLGPDHVLYVARQGASYNLIYHALTGEPVVLYTSSADIPFAGIWSR